MVKLEVILPALLFLSVVFMLPVSADASDEMTVEANVLANVKIVSISVPDYVYFGNITRGQMSNKTKIEINNTGNTDITITPQLEDSSEKIFKYLYFGTSTCTDSCKIIGNYSLDIAKPTLSAGFRSASFYMKLDLTNYPEDIIQDMPNHQARVIFYAMEQ